MNDDPKTPRNAGIESALSLSVGASFFLANLLFAAIAGQLGFFDQYLKASILLLGIGGWTTIERAKLGASGAIVLSIICLLIVLLNLAFVGVCGLWRHVEARCGTGQIGDPYEMA